MKGKISIFGCGDDPRTPDIDENDKGMHDKEGLAFFEHKEADLRPDLFYPADQYPGKGTSKRLRHDALFFAYRAPKGVRRIQQLTIWAFRNPRNNLRSVASLVDRGPSDTHPRAKDRVFDISPRLAELLQVKTDEVLEGYPLTTI